MPSLPAAWGRSNAPGPEGTHGKRPSIAGAGYLFGAIKAIGLRGWADDVRPIPLEVLCRAFLAVLREPRDGEILLGRDLWKLGG